ncbi:protein translocase subunit SecD [Nocardioides yefusunii]|uniref:Multifunctional fusion protein n=1 Tax=Nocardioides yefusunii TaxID=2500546 RepID=A0ABW1QXM8_9ACTN|nr:protein translocase subunit SecD [Nocardioides yefusunii]
MSRSAWIRFVLVLGLLAGCAALAITKKPTLGLDLRGGMSITLQAKDADGVEANAENTDRAKDVIEKRVNGLGLSEPNIYRSGSDKIVVELPDVKDPEAAKEQVGKQAQLSIHGTIANGLAEGAEPSAEGNQVLPDAGAGAWVEVGPAQLGGSDVTSAQSRSNASQGGGFVVDVEFSDDGAKKFKTLTADAACDTGLAPSGNIAVVLDGEVLTDAHVQGNCGSSMSSSTQISGNYTAESAGELAALIEGGSLPLPLETINVREIGPSLGEDAIQASILAGVVGIALTGVFIVAVYRFVGLMATIALASYALLSYAMLIALGSTLTLPGLAGFVLAIGMAIDANVLVFERAREEYAANPKAGLRRALVVGFDKAWTAIIDSQVTTLLAAGLLFFLGSGPIKGFGVTLSIGVIASMISALIIARVLTEIGVSTKFLAKRPNVTGIGDIGRVRTWLDRKNPDILGKSKLFLGISVVVTLVAILGMFVRPLNLGIEFSGGHQLEYSTTQKVSADEVRDALAKEGQTDISVQETDKDKILIRTSELSTEEKATIENVMEEIGQGATQVLDEEVSASFGKTLRDKAIIAFMVAFLAQLAYLAFRFKWTFGVAAITAMVHDVVIVVGLFAWLQKPIDGIFLAAAMTIIGLSVNDTVVVFDRIRERWRNSGDDADFTAEANRAAVETLPRTVNTGLGTMFILAALAIIGGDSLQDFAIALLVGLIVGTYSSVFTATPLVAMFQKKSPLSKTLEIDEIAIQRDESGAVV